MADLISIEKEIARIQKQIDAASKELVGLQARLSSPGFREKAKAEVVAAAESATREKVDTLSKLTSSLEGLRRAQPAAEVKKKRRDS